MWYIVSSQCQQLKNVSQVGRDKKFQSKQKLQIHGCAKTGILHDRDNIMNFWLIKQQAYRVIIIKKACSMKVISNCKIYWYMYSWRTESSMRNIPDSVITPSVHTKQQMVVTLISKQNTGKIKWHHCSFWKNQRNKSDNFPKAWFKLYNNYYSYCTV